MIRFKKQEEEKPVVAKAAPKAAPAATETAKPKPAAAKTVAAKRKKAETGDDATLDFAKSDGDADKA